MAGNSTHYTGWKGDYQEQSALGSYGGIYAGQLHEWSRVLDCSPADVLDGIDALGIEPMTQIANEDVTLHHISLVRDDAQALSKHIGSGTDALGA